MAILSFPMHDVLHRCASLRAELQLRRANFDDGIPGHLRIDDRQLRSRDAQARNRGLPESLNRVLTLRHRRSRWQYPRTFRIDRPDLVELSIGNHFAAKPLVGL